jgi:glycosyltransferase involved in cell wall biosynthesis
MRGVYAGTRIMLVPSEWEETWGRVVTEAQVSGIPVLATNYAALPESVGPGGLLVAHDAPLDEWVRALRALWDDQALYENLSQRALEHAARPEAQPQHAAVTFLAGLRQSEVRQTFQGQSPRASMRS